MFMGDLFRSLLINFEDWFRNQPLQITANVWGGGGGGLYEISSRGFKLQ